MQTYSEEGGDCAIHSRGDGHRFLRITNRDLHWLPGEAEAKRLQVSTMPSYWADPQRNVDKEKEIAKPKLFKKRFVKIQEYLQKMYASSKSSTIEELSTDELDRLNMHNLELISIFITWVIRLLKLIRSCFSIFPSARH